MVKRAALNALLCVTEAIVMIMICLVMIGLIVFQPAFAVPISSSQGLSLQAFAQTAAVEPYSDVYKTGNGPMDEDGGGSSYLIGISNLEFWNIKSKDEGSRTGFEVKGKLWGDTIFHMEYDPTLRNSADDEDPIDEWITRFCSLRSEFGNNNISFSADPYITDPYNTDPYNGYDSGEVGLEATGPWFLAIANPHGSLSYGRIRSGISSSIIDWSKPVDGFHLSGRSGDVEASIFSGRVRQGFREEAIRAEEGKRTYRLEYEDIVPGSDFLQIQLRVGSEPVAIFIVPYHIDYDSGVLYLDQSIPADIEGLPVYIVVAYDYYSPTDTGSGYFSRGAKITLTRGRFSGGISYLNDQYERSPMEILSIGGLLGGAGAYLGYEYAFMLPGLEGQEDVRDPGAWSLELGYSPFERFMLIGKYFGKGEDFASSFDSSGRPGQSGWKVEALGDLGLFNLSLRYGVERDRSNYEYPGELRIKENGFQVESKLFSGVSVFTGGSIAEKEAPGDPAYPDVSDGESWVGLRGGFGGWSYTATYGWGMKYDNDITSTSYGRLLRRRFYSLDLVQGGFHGLGPSYSQGGEDPAGQPGFYLGLRREIGRDLVDESFHQIRDGVYFDIRRSADMLYFDIGGEIFKEDTLYVFSGYSEEYHEGYYSDGFYSEGYKESLLEGYRESLLGGSLNLGVAFMPSNRFVVKGDINLVKEDISDFIGDDFWSVCGELGLSAAITDEHFAEASYRYEDGDLEADLSVMWQPNPDRSDNLSGLVSVSMMRFTATYDKSYGDLRREYGVEADLRLPSDIIVTPCYAIVEDVTGDGGVSDEAVRSGVKISKAFGDIARLWGVVERAESRNDSSGVSEGRSSADRGSAKMIYGIACQYNIERNVGIQAGYSWGEGFGDGIFDEPQGFWMGITNAF